MWYTLPDARVSGQRARRGVPPGCRRAPGRAAVSRIAVIGSSSPVGAAVLARLAQLDDVEELVGVDVEAPEMPLPRVRYRTMDVRDRLLPLALEGCDAVVHAAPADDVALSEDTLFGLNVGGLRNVLAACDAVGVRRLVVLSNHLVYGAHPDNPVPLPETARLRANPDFAFGYQRQLCEELLAEWAAEHPDAAVTVLRTAPPLGPGVDHAVAQWLSAPRLVTVAGHEPPAQLVHVDDVAEAVAHVLERDLTGAYNVAADGWLTVHEVAAAMGRRLQPVPETSVEQLLRRAWGLRVGPIPPGALHYLKHPVVLDTTALRDTGWAARRTNRDILAELAAEHRGWVTLGRSRVRTAQLWRAAAVVGGILAVGLWRALRRG